MSDREATIQALNDCHSFPCPFTFRVIGEGSAAFEAAVVAALESVLGQSAKPSVNSRMSAQKNHQAVTMVVLVASAEQVLQVYAALQNVKGVRMVL